MDLTILQNLTLREVLLAFGICAAAAVIPAIVLLYIAGRQVAEIEIPEDADFFETLQHVPITVPLALDLLDGAFDIFAAPISWVILELMGLTALQMITVFEGIIPGTQLIPTMTIAWVVARLMRNKRSTPLRESLHEYQQQNTLRRNYSLRDQYRSQSLLPGGPDSNVIDGEFIDDDLDEPPPDYYERIDDFEDEEADW